MKPYVGDGGHGGDHDPECGCRHGHRRNDVHGYNEMRGAQMRRGHGMRPEPFGPPGGFGVGGSGRFGRGPKAGRGDVKLGILALLSEVSCHGYEIMQELSARSNGMWQPSPGSVYPTLQALEDQELLISDMVEGKRVYSITENGRSFLESNRRQLPPWEELGGNERNALFDFRKDAFQLGAAMMQIAQTGSQDQIQRARKLLADTRKAVYRILSEDEPQNGENEPGSD